MFLADLARDTSLARFVNDWVTLAQAEPRYQQDTTRLTSALLGPTLTATAGWMGCLVARYEVLCGPAQVAVTLGRKAGLIELFHWRVAMWGVCCRAQDALTDEEQLLIKPDHRVRAWEAQLGACAVEALSAHFGSEPWSAKHRVG